MSETPQAEQEFLTPQEAEPLLRQAAQPYLDEGWQPLRLTNYIFRLHRDRELLDIQVDLSGNIQIEEKVAVLTTAEYGRMIAWVVLLVSFIVILFAANLLGLLD
jgi:hypothetical protein